jgi:hypothetical protein
MAEVLDKKVACDLSLKKKGLFDYFVLIYHKIRLINSQMDGTLKAIDLNLLIGLMKELDRHGLTIILAPLRLRVIVLQTVLQTNVVVHRLIQQPLAVVLALIVEMVMCDLYLSLKKK